MLNGLAQRYLAPLGMMHFPEAALPSDIDHTYAFVVRYEQGGDVALKEHADASVITLNLCLRKDNVSTDAGDLEFAPYVPFGASESSDGQALRTKLAFGPGDA